MYLTLLEAETIKNEIYYNYLVFSQANVKLLKAMN